MKDRELHDAIVTSVLESLTGTSLVDVTPSTKLMDLVPNIELTILGLSLQHAAAERGILLGDTFTQSIQGASPSYLTITKLRKMVAAAAGDEDFDIPWPPKKR